MPLAGYGVSCRAVRRRTTDASATSPSTISGEEPMLNRTSLLTLALRSMCIADARRQPCHRPELLRIARQCRAGRPGRGDSGGDDRAHEYRHQRAPRRRERGKWRISLREPRARHLQARGRAVRVSALRTGSDRGQRPIAAAHRGRAAAGQPRRDRSSDRCLASAADRERLGWYRGEQPLRAGAATERPQCAEPDLAGAIGRATRGQRGQPDRQERVRRPATTKSAAERRTRAPSTSTE